MNRALPTFTKSMLGPGSLEERFLFPPLRKMSGNPWLGMLLMTCLNAFLLIPPGRNLLAPFLHSLTTSKGHRMPGPTVAAAN